MTMISPLHLRWTLFCWLLLAASKTVSAQFFVHPSYERNTYHINANTVRLRTSPSLNGEVLHLLELGTPVSLMRISEAKDSAAGKWDHWCYVTLYLYQYQTNKSDSVSGWVFGSFLSEGVFNFYDWAMNQETKYEVPELFRSLQTQRWVGRNYYSDWNMGDSHIEFRNNGILLFGYEFYGLAGVQNVKQTGVLRLEITAYMTHQAGLGEPSLVFPSIPGSLPYSSATRAGKVMVDIYPGWDSIRVTEYEMENGFYDFAGGKIYYPNNWVWERVNQKEVPVYEAYSYSPQFSGSYFKKGEWVAVSSLPLTSDTFGGKPGFWIFAHQLQPQEGVRRECQIRKDALSPATFAEVRTYMKSNFHLSGIPDSFHGKKFLCANQQGTDTLWVKPQWIEIHHADGRVRMVDVPPDPQGGWQDFGVCVLVDPLFPGQMLYEDWQYYFGFRFSESGDKIELQSYVMHEKSCTFMITDQ